MLSTLKIRKACTDDAEAIARFQVAMAQETEGKSLDYGTVNQGVRHLIEHPDYGFYIVAEQGGGVVASLLVTYEWSDWRNGLFQWIQSVYVKPAFRRKGIYSQMYIYLTELVSKEKNGCGFRLYVEKNNNNAQAAYEKLGMYKTGYQIYEQNLKS
jgi:ribosomal protein S18 acetylase RimI-like enzyme